MIGCPVCPVVLGCTSICDAPEACEICIFRDCKTIEDCEKAYKAWCEECNNL